MENKNITPKPGEKALEALKKLDKDVAVFKIPQVIKRRARNSTVLDEDTYIEEMAKIIQRDFFPDLEKLKAQNDFLDATERKDHQKLRELYIKYSSGQRPPTERYASPATFETPHAEMPGTPHGPPPGAASAQGPVSTRSNRSKKEKTISTNHSLNSYLAAYTSEDNSSFEELMVELDSRVRARFAGQLQEEEDSLRRLQQVCTVPSVEEQADQTRKPEALDTWSYKAKNFIMYVPDGQAPSPDMSKEHQEVVHSNTRLEVEPFDYQRSKETISQIAKSQERILSGRIGVDGSTLLGGRQAEGTAPSVTTGGLGGGGLGGPGTAIGPGPRLLPMSTAHCLVRTPSPNPGESPLMTWGEIEGSPFRLDGGDTPLPGKASGASFKMGVVPQRERLALALAERAGQRHRALKNKSLQAKRSMLSPSPRLATGSTADRLAAMSPAAQRLATSQLRRLLSSPRASPRASPRHTPGRSAHPPARAATPRGDDKKKKTLTDDLLQINLPKRNRLKAADFFT